MTDTLPFVEINKLDHLALKGCNMRPAGNEVFVGGMTNGEVMLLTFRSDTLEKVSPRRLVRKRVTRNVLAKREEYENGDYAWRAFSSSVSTDQ